MINNAIYNGHELMGASSTTWILQIWVDLL